MSHDRTAAGLAYGIAAYLSWGLVPVFWRHLRHVSATEILGHRVIWGLGAFALLLWLRGRMDELRAALREPRIRRTMLASSALLASNWLTFIYAVNTERVLHASLGYFINPLVSVLLGMIFLRERLRPLQWLALILAAAGVAQYAQLVGGVPWISLVLASTFGLYGLLRKTMKVEALPGSTAEVLFLLPLALVYLVALAARGEGRMPSSDLSTQGLLAATGLVTALPLLWFANAARRLPLTAIGFLQYLAPTGQFVLAVAVFGETFELAHLRSFVPIWIGIALFSADLWAMKHARRTA